MSFLSLPELTVVFADGPTPLIDPALLKDVSPTANNYEEASGYSILFIIDNPAYIGGEDVSPTSASLMPATGYPLVCSDRSIPYIHAPAGTTVKVKRLVQGPKA